MARASPWRRQSPATPPIVVRLSWMVAVSVTPPAKSTRRAMGLCSSAAKAAGQSWPKVRLRAKSPRPAAGAHRLMVCGRGAGGDRRVHRSWSQDKLRQQNTHRLHGLHLGYAELGIIFPTIRLRSSECKKEQRKLHSNEKTTESEPPVE